MSSAAQSQGHLSSLAAHGALSARGLGVHKELGGDRTSTADLNWPKGYSILYDIMQRNLKMVKSWLGRQPLLRDCLTIGWWVVCNCFVHHLLCLYIYYYYNYYPFFLFIFFISTHKFYFVFFLILSPIPLGGG